MLVAFFPSLFGFGYLGEAPFMRHSLATVSAWGIGMKVTVLIITVVVLFASGYHLYLAYSTPIILQDSTETGSILGWYIIFGMFGPLFLVVGYIVCWYQNTLAKKSVKNPITEGRENDRETTKVSFHPHHWAIFYCLAFMTRFENVVSNIFAGIFIGIYMHGVSAYGHDFLLEQ
jgi:hypothetical protein